MACIATHTLDNTYTIDERLAVGLVSLIRTQRHAKLLLLSITGSIIIDARRGALHA